MITVCSKSKLKRLTSPHLTYPRPTPANTMFGRALLTLDSIMLLFGAFIADWNETHIHNPNWPPHAK